MSSKMALLDVTVSPSKSPTNAHFITFDKHLFFLWKVRKICFYFLFSTVSIFFCLLSNLPLPLRQMCQAASSVSARLPGFFLLFHSFLINFNRSLMNPSHTPLTFCSFVLTGTRQVSGCRFSIAGEAINKGPLLLMCLCVLGRVLSGHGDVLAAQIPSKSLSLAR